MFIVSSQTLRLGIYRLMVIDQKQGLLSKEKVVSFRCIFIIHIHVHIEEVNIQLYNLLIIACTCMCPLFLHQIHCLILGVNRTLQGKEQMVIACTEAQLQCVIVLNTVDLS